MRQQRVADLVHYELAHLLRQSVYDPRLRDVALTSVDISPDLKQAKIFYTLLSSDPSQSQLVQKALDKSVGYFRSSLAKSVALRKIPMLRFIYDASVERGKEIDDLIDLI